MILYDKKKGEWEMTFKEILFNIIIPLISGIIGGTISANIIVHKNIKKSESNFFFSA